MNAPAPGVAMTARQRDALVIVDTIIDVLNLKLPVMIEKAVAAQLAKLHPARGEKAPDVEELTRELLFEHVRGLADASLARSSPPQVQP